MTKYKLKSNRKMIRDFTIVMGLCLFLLIVSLIKEGIAATPTIVMGSLLVLSFILRIVLSTQDNKRSKFEIKLDNYGIQKTDNKFNSTIINWDEISSVENRGIENCVEIKSISGKKKIKIDYDYEKLTELLNTIISKQIVKENIQLPKMIHRDKKPLVIISLIFIIFWCWPSRVLFKQNNDIAEIIILWIFVLIFMCILLIIDVFTATKYIKITNKYIEIKKGIKVRTVLFENIKDIYFKVEYGDQNRFLNIIIETYNEKQIKPVPDSRSDLINIYKYIICARNSAYSGHP